MAPLPGREGPGVRYSGILVAVLAVVVVAGTIAAYVDFQHKVDDATASATDPGRAPRPGGSDSSPSTPANPSASADGPPTTPGPKVLSLWVGDGYTAGTGADGPQSGEACVAARQLGWRCELAAERGTGFLNNGHVFDASYAALPDRLDQLPDPSSGDQAPDVVVVDAGRNDLGVFAEAAIEQAMGDYLRQLRNRYPDAALIQIVPWSLGQDEPHRELRAAVVRVMHELDGHVLDPYARGWAGAGKTDLPDLRSSSGGSTQAGHDLIGHHLARAIRGLDLTVPTAG